MNKIRGISDLTEGSIMRALLSFAIPILIGNIFQQLYNVADTAVIGNFLGDDALAAVGATGPIYELVIGMAGGFTNGFAVIVARNFGAKKEEDMRKSVVWTMVLTLLLAAVLTSVGLFGMRSVLKILKTPAGILDDAELYIKIIVGFSTVTLLYNMFAGLLRAIGNSKMPLYFLAISTVLNIVLDIVFVNNLNFGIAGAAYATVIAQFLAVVLCVIYIYKKCPFLRFSKKYLEKDIQLIKELITTGFSMGMMIVVVVIGTVALQIAVNSFGEDIIAAHNSARKIVSMLMLPITTFTTASATFCSQNYGANKMNRVKKGIYTSLIICFAWGIVASIIISLWGDTLVRIITGSDSQAVVDAALQYNKISIPFFHALTVLVILRSSLQGIGQKIVPLAASVIELVVKFVAVGLIRPEYGYFSICIVEPVIWVICAAVVLIDYLMFMKKNNTIA